MTQADMRATLNLGPEWEALWTGANPLDSHQHLCGGLYGPGGTSTGSHQYNEGFDPATNCDSTKRGEMDTYHGFVRRVLMVLLIIASLPMVAQSAEKPASAKGASSKREASLRERGRYLVILGGCNDCHTPGFAQSGGTVPEGEWLTGDSIGWRGPWGTTYPPNLRLLMQGMSEAGWVQFAHAVRGNPPMPFWTLQAMTAQDLGAMYRFIKSLGPKGVPAPPGLPPGEEPKTPYILFVPQVPK